MTTPASPKSMVRDQTFDLMRLVALLIIITMHHLPDYYHNFYDLRKFGIQANISFLVNLTRYLGLGSFIFMSGYLLSIKKYPMNGLGDVLAFLKKRFLHIFPLYWLAIILFMAMFHIDPGKNLGPLSTALHVFGLQLFYGKQMLTIWFVGLITIYYVLFAAISYCAAINNCGEKGDMTITLCLATFFFLFTLKTVFNTIDNRVVMYWPIFVFGIYFSRARPRIDFTKFALAAIVTAATSYVHLTYFKRPEWQPMALPFLLDVGLLSILMGSFIVALYYLCAKVKLQSVSRLAYLGAYSSFAVYLFHRPVYQITKNALGRDGQWLVSVLAFSAAIVFLFTASYCVQSLYDYFIKKLTRAPSGGIHVTVADQA